MLTHGETKVLTMTEAMRYLRISSRSAFYKLLEEGRIKYVNLNPGGEYEIRRFTIEELDRFLAGGGGER